MKTPLSVEKFLASPEGQRFTKLAGMLGSEHVGEAGNAAMMANRLLREAGLTWGELLGAAPAADTRGGQQPAINSLRYRLRIEQEAVSKLTRQLDAERKAHAGTRSRIGVLEAQVRAQKPTPNLIDWNVDRDDFEKTFKITLNVAMRDIDDVVSALGIDPKTAPKPKKAERKYDTELQRDINEVIDTIEAAIELNGWETDFCASIRKLKYKFSEKQCARLEVLAKQAGIKFELEPVGYD